MTSEAGLFVDASALVAVITNEPESRTFTDALLNRQPRCTSSLALFEAAAALTRKLGGDAAAAEAGLTDLLESLGVAVLVMDTVTGDLARGAWRRYGRGSGHPARLNMGDCFAYACARQHGLALLFKGEDFIHTDIVPAVPAATDQGSSQVSPQISPQGSS